MSKTKSLHHIVFATKHRQMTISEPHKKELYGYIFGIIKNKGCHLKRMNGIADHIHMLIDLHPSVALADFVKDVKQYSSLWIGENPKFPLFSGWGVGYYAVSIGVEGEEACVNYIKRQEEHHLGHEFMTEMEEMAKTHGLVWYPDDWA